jgi:hypothetical protein
LCIHEQVREFLDPMAVSSNSGRNRQPRSGLLTPDSELADEEVDRLGGAGHHLQNPNDNVDTLGDGERALVHAMCNVIFFLVSLHNIWNRNVVLDCINLTVDY